MSHIWEWVISSHGSIECIYHFTRTNVEARHSYENTSCHTYRSMCDMTYSRMIHACDMTYSHMSDTPLLIHDSCTPRYILTLECTFWHMKLLTSIFTHAYANGVYITFLHMKCTFLDMECTFLHTECTFCKFQCENTYSICIPMCIFTLEYIGMHESWMKKGSDIWNTYSWHD